MTNHAGKETPMALPPPIIDSARLVAFAENDDDVTYTGKLSLHVGGGASDWETVGEMPGLVILNPYNCPQDFLLGFCDESWEVSAVIAFETPDAAKAQAESYYSGITGKWRDTPYSENQIRQFLRDEYRVDPDSEWWLVRCSFCGRQDIDTSGMVASESAQICYECIEQFYSDIAGTD